MSVVNDLAIALLNALNIPSENVIEYTVTFKVGELPTVTVTSYVRDDVRVDQLETKTVVWKAVEERRDKVLDR